jgi:23S rRNA pseudouridine2604 synthase
MEFPMRINKYLAHRKYSTRRGADALIEAGKVRINGKLAQLGDKVTENDKVVVDQKAVDDITKKHVYFAFNKPIGVVTHSPQRGEKSIEHVSGLGSRVFPIGRLDKDSHGLIILTSDGRVTEALLHPDKEHEKEYRVRVDKPLSEHFFTQMAKGVKIEDYITKKAKLDGEPGSKTFSIIISEGKKHQIRRMVTALGYKVEDLKRTRVANIEIGELKPGEKRQITGKELQAFLKGLGLA